ncbi:MAG: UDP-glucose 4-epimerase GalE [Caryophanon sp.]|nr:UDP-glucose 4-epimerase GalE [Caryophanon sp.]
MLILVTGGAGYIGSHTAISLVELGHSIIIADDFSNSKPETVEVVQKITGKSVATHRIDVTDRDALERIFQNHQLEGVIHFAGYKAVGESVIDPIKYYKNNIISTLNIADLCVKYNVLKFVFSSSATVYGDNASPLTENMMLLPTTNPYGETKAMCERILHDISIANPQMQISLLRYFNPVGAHESGLIGENPNGIPNNLMPYITQVASGTLKKLSIFGNDYPTIDGTGVRDFIHVEDLAKGHVAALEHLSEGVHIHNLGTGKGTSVLQLVKAFEKVNQIEIPYEIVERRPGDLAKCYADVSKAERELGWKAEKTIEDMCRDAWNFEKNLKSKM